MLGTIGHDQPIDDRALLEGKISHKVTKLWINENGIGMGEIQVLATSSGKELNAMLRGGIKLPVSSRALGEFRGKTASGSQIIDENTYQLEGFDWVLRPGVESAIPVLVESHTENNEVFNTSLPKENTMSHEILESVMNEKIKLTEELSEALNKVSTLSSENSALRSVVDSKNKEISRLEESDKSKIDTIKLVEAETVKVREALESELTSVKSVLAVYEKLGTTEELDEALDKSDSLISKYKIFGTAEELTEAFNRMESFVEDVANIGTTSEMEELLSVVEHYQTLGTPEAIVSKSKLLATYEGLGSADDLASILSITEKYAELGTVAEIVKAFEMTEAVVGKIRADERSKVAKEIANENEVEVAIVESLLQKHTADETKKLISSLRKVDPSDRYRKTATNESTATGNKKINLHESATNESLKQDRAKNLMEKFSR
jgi:hypothetical protein